MSKSNLFKNSRLVHNTSIESWSHVSIYLNVKIFTDVPWLCQNSIENYTKFKKLPIQHLCPVWLETNICLAVMAISKCHLGKLYTLHNGFHHNSAMTGGKRANCSRQPTKRGRVRTQPTNHYPISIKHCALRTLLDLSPQLVHLMTLLQQIPLLK